MLSDVSCNVTNYISTYFLFSFRHSGAEPQSPSDPQPEGATGAAAAGDRGGGGGVAAAGHVRARGEAAQAGDARQEKRTTPALRDHQRRRITHTG